MSIETLITSLEKKIEVLTQNINSASGQVKQWSDNHNGLVGMLQGVKESLEEAKKIANIAAPDSTITSSLNSVENVANVVENVIDAVNL